MALVPIPLSELNRRAKAGEPLYTFKDHFGMQPRAAVLLGLILVLTIVAVIEIATQGL
jgi:hypothetical protein